MTTHFGSKLGADAKTFSLLAKTIQNSYTFLGRKVTQTNNFIKDYTALYIGVLAVLATVGVGLVSHNATIEAAKIQSNTSLSTYIASMNQLLIPKESKVSGPTIDEEMRTLLRSNSLLTLRNLTGYEKGTFVRFLAEKELIRADQSRILLAGADLRNIVLKDAWLPDVNLQRTYLLDADLSNSDLTRSNLSNAVLTRANLTGAILTDANFSGAVLTDAQLDVEKAIRDGAKFCNATMPNGGKGDCP